MAHTPPLRIVVLFHPASKASRELALDIYRRFAASGGSPGVRIPVAFAPKRPGGAPPEDVALDAATHTLVVALVDGRMAQRARPEDRASADAWADLFVQLLGRATTGTAMHGLVPVCVDDGAFGLTPRLADRSFVRLDRFLADPARMSEELAFHVAAAALQLVAGRPLPGEPMAKAPIRLFLSHAKADLPGAPAHPAEGPVYELLAYLAKGPVDGWYDAKNIPRGKRFDEALREGVIACDVIVSILTDAYSDREWCRREALIAKRAGIPLVMVDALRSEIPRLFPYLGNARTLRWDGGRSAAVVLAALIEALRHQHAVAVLKLRAHANEIILGVQPETLTLLRLPANTRRVVYPDPPLPQEEVEELMPVLTRGGGPLAEASTGELAVELTTPLSDIARWRRPSELDLVGLSLSGATDIAAWGASSEHLRTLADDLVTMLLVAGVRLAYGGVFAHGAVQGDEVNYTTELFARVRSYSPLANNLGSSGIHPIVNVVPWPTHLGYGAPELKLYGQEATLEPGPSPALAPDALAALARDDRGFFPREPGIRAWAYARGTTAMREEMGRRLSARVALAGKLEGYAGLLPGVLEEILVARLGERPIPLYLLGAFGGATRLAIDLLQGRLRPEATAAWVEAHVAGYTDLVGEYQRRGDSVVTPEEAAQRLRALGGQGPARALDNGLNDAENRELFDATDSTRIVELVLTGLRRRFPEQG
jgi:hypothetical protein